VAKKIFEGLGPGTLVPQRGHLPLTDSRIGAEEGFVLSRVDGQTSLQEICLLVPFEEPVTMVILRRLWELGAIEVPGVARQMPAPHKPEPKEPPRPPTPAAEREPGKAGADASPRATALSLEQMRRIDEFFATLDERDAFQLLEVPRDADARAIKRAYYKLSKEFHPDRYYATSLGDYGKRLSAIFQAVKAAFELLSDDPRRTAYLESLKGS
jgi:hypothetical protein